MKLIKFRVYDVARSTMHKVNHIVFNQATFKPERVYANTPNGQYLLQGKLDGGKKDAFKLMQYIGLKDAVGREIYEGDIVQYEDDRDWLWVVKWDDYDARFILYSEDDVDFFGVIGSLNVGVIGNIYENPELIKGVKDER